MASELRVKTGTIIVLANTDHNPADINNLGERTKQIDLTSLAAGAARQSDKFDFGALRAGKYNLAAAIEFLTAPIASETIDFYLAFSPNETPANANPGGVSGSDSAYTGYSSNLKDSLEQLFYVGSLTLTVQYTTIVQIDTNIGVFIPPERYATLIVVNKAAADNLVGDAVEMSVLISPSFLYEIQ